MIAFVIDTDDNFHVINDAHLIGDTMTGETGSDPLAVAELIDCDFPNASIIVCEDSGAVLEALGN